MLKKRKRSRKTIATSLPFLMRFLILCNTTLKQMLTHDYEQITLVVVSPVFLLS